MADLTADLTPRSVAQSVGTVGVGRVLGTPLPRLASMLVGFSCVGSCIGRRVGDCLGRDLKVICIIHLQLSEARVWGKSQKRKRRGKQSSVHVQIDTPSVGSLGTSGCRWEVSCLTGRESRRPLGKGPTSEARHAASLRCFVVSYNSLSYPCPNV